MRFQIGGRIRGVLGGVGRRVVTGKVERGEHPPRAEARPPSKGDGGKEEPLATLREPKDEPLAKSAVTDLAGGAAGIRMPAGGASEVDVHDLEQALEAAEMFNLPQAGNIYRFAYYQSNPDAPQTHCGVDPCSPGTPASTTAGVPTPR